MSWEMTDQTAFDCGQRHQVDATAKRQGVFKSSPTAKTFKKKLKKPIDKCQKV